MMSVEGAFHDLHADPSSCPTCSLWQQSGESSDAWKARIRHLFQTGRERKPPGRPRGSVMRLISALSVDRWTKGEAVAAQLGVSPVAARTALWRAQKRGAPIESQQSLGYRLRKDAA